MNKAEIISELENMAAARLFGRQPWLADRETHSAVKRKLIQMGLVEVVGRHNQNDPLPKEAPASEKRRCNCLVTDCETSIFPAFCAILLSNQKVG
jgi:hypothetical protein